MKPIQKKEKFKLTKAQAGFYMWGHFDIRRGVLERAGFDSIKDALHFYFNNRADIMEHYDRMDARTEEIDQNWNQIAFETFCKGRWCGKNCESKNVTPFHHGQPQDEPWTEGDPDDYALYGD